MRVINFDHTKDLLSKEKPFVMFVFTDTHLGFVGADIKKLKRHIEQCRQEDAYWVHLGDWCDAIGPRDRRFDFSIHKDPIEYQYRQVEKLFMPIADRGIAVLQGNHDDQFRRSYGDKVATMAERLNVPYLGFSGFVGVRAWTRQADMEKRKGAELSFTLFLHHGHGMGRLLGAKMINIHRMSHKFEADCYLLGHVHTFTRHTDEYLRVNRASSQKGRLYLWRHNRAYASAPGYYGAYTEELNEYDEPITTYAERAGVYSQPTGCLKITVYPIQKQSSVRLPGGKRQAPGKHLIYGIEPLLT